MSMLHKMEPEPKPAQEEDRREDALQLLMESRECIAACFRAMSASDDKKIMDRLEMNLALAGVKHGIGVRIQNFVRLVRDERDQFKDKINAIISAALAAERENVDRLTKQIAIGLKCENKLTAQLDAERVQLQAWNEAFGTTQLTHAIARLESVEKQLAAERKIRSGMEKAMESAAASEKQLREQLAEERKRYIEREKTFRKVQVEWAEKYRTATEQLADEREKRKEAEQDAKADSDENDRLRSQLAELVDALKDFNEDAFDWQKERIHAALEKVGK